MLDFIHPNLLALIAATNVAISRILYRTAITKLSTFYITFIWCSVSVVTSISFYLVDKKIDIWPVEAIMFFLLVGILGGFIARYALITSIKYVGLARTSVLNQTSLAWSSTFGVFIFLEDMNVWLFCGTFSIMLGSILLVYDPKGKLKVVSKYVYLIPLGNSFIIAISHILRKDGLMLLPSGSFGVAVSSVMALFCMFLVMPFSKGTKIKSLDGRSVVLVMIGAFFNSVSAIFFWTAVMNGRLVEVVPVNRLSVLMIIFLSWLFFRKQEFINTRVVLGGVMAVTGALLVVLGK
ncbi:MAG: EamA family transporter [Nitrospinota bacterium]|nr:EamA family transporter [Nitrospinota bacterium]